MAERMALERMNALINGVISGIPIDDIVETEDEYVFYTELLLAEERMKRTNPNLSHDPVNEFP